MNKQIRSLLLICVLLHSGCGEPLIVEKYENGNVSLAYYTNEQGERDGHYISYYENGNKRSEGEYRNDKQVDYWRCWYDTGLLLSEGYYNSDGFQNGEWFFYDSTGHLQQREFFQDGIKHGKFTEYYQSGGVKRNGNVVNGKMYGMDTSFYENGIVASVHKWREGIVIDTVREYRRSGSLFSTEIREDSANVVFFIHDSVSGDTLIRHKVVSGRFSDTAIVYRMNKPFKDTIVKW
jgi:antitoxin component YwqK of YwqJK toxin-antitoxin module